MTVIAILGLLDGVLGFMGGWFTQASWDNGGKVVNQAYSGLKQLSGQTYPDIENKLDTVHDKWRTFQSAWPWDKASTATAYYQECANVAQMIKAQVVSLPATTGKPNITKIIFWVAIPGSLVTIMAILLALNKKRKK